MQVLFQDGKFQWKRLQNLIGLAREGTGGLDLSDTVRDGARVLLLDEKLRRQLLLALTEDNRLHIEVPASRNPMSSLIVHHQAFYLCKFIWLLLEVAFRVLSRPNLRRTIMVQEIQQLYELIQDDINPQKIVQQTLADLPSLSRQLILGWSDRVLSS